MPDQGPYYYTLPEADADDYRRRSQDLVERIRQSSRPHIVACPAYEIGPVRAYYYEELVTGGPHPLQCAQSSQGAAPSRFNVGGRPRWSHHWQAQDAYLADVLRSVGTSWLSVERAMLDAFWRAAPPAFRKSLRGNRRHCMGAWQTQWTTYTSFSVDWKSASSRNTMAVFAQQAGALYQRARELKHTGAPRRHPLCADTLRELRNLWQRAEAVKWTEDLNADFPRFRTLRESPFLKPVTVLTAQELWKSIEVSSTPTHPDISRMVQRKGAADLDDVRRFVPIQFWRLVADLLWHCEVVFGLPDDRHVKWTASCTRDQERTVVEVAMPPASVISAHAHRKRYANSFLSLPSLGTRPPQFFGPWPQVGNKRY